MANEMGGHTQADINTKLAEVSASILPDGMILVHVPLDHVREQDVNAQSMPQKMFDQLADNIRATGGLESIPLVVRVSAVRYDIISGHHRIRAARAAGLSSVLCLCYTSLPAARIKAKQLAHNSITGVSDPALVKRIWEGIDDIAARFESFIDPRDMDQKLKPVKVSPPDVSFQTKTLLFVFLATQAQTVEQALSTMPDMDADTIYVAHRADFDAFRDALARVRQDCEIVSATTAVTQMARLALAYLEEHAEKTEE